MTAGSDQADTGGRQAEIVRRTGRFGDDKDPNLGKGTQFKPGQSGNPAGPRRGQSLSATIQKMLDDPRFIDKLSAKIKAKIIDLDDPDALPDTEFQGTPMRAIITTALIEAMDPTKQPGQRQMARDWLAKYGYGTKVDVTSKGERISETPKIISAIQPREDGDAPAQTEAS